MKHWTPTKKILAIGSVIGVGLLVQHCRRKYAEHNGSPIPLDADLDSDTRKAIFAALSYETDLALLHTFAQKLESANHPKAAHAINAKLYSLRAA